MQTSQAPLAASSFPSWFKRTRILCLPQSVDVKIEVVVRYRQIYTGTGALAASLITFIVEGIVSLCAIPIREICSLTLGCHLSNIDNYIHIYAFKLVPPLCSIIYLELKSALDYAY